MNLFKSELMSTLNHMRKHYAGDKKAIDRVNRGFGIAQRGGGLSPYMGNHDYVISMNEHGMVECSCPDYQYRLSRKRGTKVACKHIFALNLWLIAFAKANDVTFKNNLDGTALIKWSMYSESFDETLEIGTNISLSRLVTFNADMMQAFKLHHLMNLEQVIG